MTQSPQPRPGQSRSFVLFLSRALKLRCPECGITPVFPPLRAIRNPNGWFDTLSGCPICNYAYVREPGYFLLATWGTGFLVPSLLGIILMFWLPYQFKLGPDAQLALIIPIVALTALLFARHSRAIFLAVDHYFDPVRLDT